MQKENKLLFGAVLILLIAIISFSFGGITGQVTKFNQVTRLYIDKSVVTAGDRIKLTVEPGSEGVSNSIDFYAADDDTRIVQSAVNICTRNKCFDKVTLEFRVPGTWEGDIYARVADKYYESIGKEKYIKAFFHVKPLELPVGPKLHR